MITLETLTNGELNLLSAQSRPSGHGHQKITFELEYRGEEKEFSRTTDNMPSFDDAQDLEGEDKELALYNIIQYKFEDILQEWMSEVDEELEEVED